MILFYRIATLLYHLMIRLGALFNSKAKKSINGRKRQKRIIKEFDFSIDTWIWFHCASLGEFEQGRPLIESIKQKHPTKKIILTFYSPSGYEIRKDYPFADFICYLPYDTPENAQWFIEQVQPKIVFFVKYEFWYFYLKTLNASRIPSFLISATFRKDQLFFRPYGRFYKKMLQFFNYIFVQDGHSKTLLMQHDIHTVQVTGDTRIDRVVEIAKRSWQDDKIGTFKGQQPLWVMGSSWPPGESLIFPLLSINCLNGWKCIIAPHDIAPKHIEDIERQLNTTYVRYSEQDLKKFEEAQVLIIDNIGLLSNLYRYGSFAYIGGGFGQGIHNTLEPIAFGLPVIFGPKYKKFDEAKVLVQTGGGYSIQNGEALKSIICVMTNDEKRLQASKAALAYVEQNVGASEKIMAYLEKEYDL